MTGSSHTAIAPARILFADDDPIMLELASARLVEAGHDIVTAEDGEAALALLEGDGAELVISDLDMPLMDGFELTRRIRAAPHLAEIPVIVVTGSDHASAVEAAFAAGATSFLAKPINWTLFNQSVMFVLKASRDQRALREARDQAEAGARFKDSLLSVMSHELRTPLNAIIGFGQILREQFDAERDHLHREYADYIIDSGKRLLDAVSDILLVSDARSGPIAIAEAECTAREIVETACAEEAGPAALAQARVSVALEEPDLTLFADRALLARALAKLIDNAIKFSPRGARVVVGATSTRQGGLVFVVKDEGPGVAPERLAALAQPLAPADLSPRRAQEGLGLGLPLAQAVAAAHGGRFRLKSAPKGGTTALIALPAARVRRVGGARREPAAADRQAAPGGS